MKALKEILSENVPAFYRFRVFVKHEDSKKTVGMAYLQEGQNIYTLRLWTFLNEKYFLFQSKECATKYLVMTREINTTPNPKTKYYWNIVGNATANASQNVLEINFDLFEKKIYLSIFPETSNNHGSSSSDSKNLAA